VKRQSRTMDEFWHGTGLFTLACFAEASEGCIVAHKEDTRKACLDFIEENLTDMRPRVLSSR